MQGKRRGLEHPLNVNNNKDKNNAISTNMQNDNN